MPTREQRKLQDAFTRVRTASERTYASTLTAIARSIDKIVRDMNPQDEESVLELRRALDRFAHAVEPWARKAALTMLRDVSNRDLTAWELHGKAAGQELRQELAETPTGTLLRRLLQDQVELITSIPIEAGQRVQRLAMGILSSGARPASLVDEIMRTGEVTRSRAVLIARTETAKAATALTQARAQQIGSEGYHWLTAHDQMVRPDHKVLDGRLIMWNNPPIADRRTKARYHAGMGIQCRCIPVPILPLHG